MGPRKIRVHAMSCLMRERHHILETVHDSSSKYKESCHSIRSNRLPIVSAHFHTGRPIDRCQPLFQIFADTALPSGETESTINVRRFQNPSSSRHLEQEEHANHNRCSSSSPRSFFVTPNSDEADGRWARTVAMSPR